MKCTVFLSAAALLAVQTTANAADYFCRQSGSGYNGLYYALIPSQGARDKFGVDFYSHDVSRPYAVSQASNTWKDTVWKGSSQGEEFVCAKNGHSCGYLWSRSETKSYTHSVGISVSAEAGLDAAFKYGLEVSVTNTFAWGTSTSQSFAANTTIDPGWAIEPIIYLDRRWRQGAFRGAYKAYEKNMIEDANSGKSYYNVCWAWDGSKTLGRWRDNVAAGNPYKSFHTWYHG